MSKYTSAYRTFLSNVKEIDRLLGFAKKLERSDPIEKRDEINALSRGAIVLLSSHIEGYIKSLGEITLDKIHEKKVDASKLPEEFFYNISKEKIQPIKDSSDPGKIAKNIFTFLQDEAIYWNKSGHFKNQINAEQFSKGFSNPKLKKIKKYFSRFGYNSYERDIKSHLKQDSSTTLNSLDHIVDTRNNIAHGDISQTQTPADIETYKKQMIDLCRATDIVYGNWCKEHYCTIRS